MLQASPITVTAHFPPGLQYELHTPQGHDPDTGEQQADGSDRHHRDTDGGSFAAGSVVVRILDDEPLARNDENNLLQDGLRSASTAVDNGFITAAIAAR